MKPPDEHIPSKRAIIPYYITAAFAFAVLALLCLISVEAFTGHYFQPQLLAITHLAVFGWATMIIFGASNQLVPVICEQKLYSERLPLVIFALLVPGTILLVTSFWLFALDTATYAGAACILVAIVLQAYNIFKTAQPAKENIVRDFMVAAHAWLAVTCTIGIMLLINLRFPFLPSDHLHYLKTHASIGMGGWFLQLVIGVSSKLIPMFLLSRTEERKLLDVSYYALNIGLVSFLTESMIFKTAVGAPLYVLMVFVGVGCYFRFVWQCYKTALRKQMDAGIRQTFIALAFMALAFVVLLAILFLNSTISTSSAIAFGSIFFAGFISTIIMGQTFKTLPFIVWMHITKPDSLPELFPKDLYREHWVRWKMWLFLVGVMIFLLGILLGDVSILYVGTGLMLVSAIWYLLHVILIVKKLKK